ncbi:MAG: HAD-IIIA family hydrolase [Alphaproteobacteria bacterium]|nr:HAD-IIIA family hydrolase [Alphaproteobacteria bacterium]MBT4018425.1 HAD-IIIA family hydrolase [Alphaproteobacteria bacterium]MBT4965347.1 HAD-IIIA family hydrolase [Alphaproteobacteria bacterium]MBT5159215.1 HAD-IIIA family hydrolase [Alphaproteobacteria bacterium]MBT5919714.1 HAD-IIIA family hydrolase [Alphaproteobacteria bacterium]
MLVLLDRDGVINHDRPDSIKNPDEFIMIDGSAKAVARLNAARHQVALVTNQSIIGRGTIDGSMLDRIHEKMTAALAREGAFIDRIYVCPDAPWEATERRKPGPGMLFEALSDFSASAAQTPFVGDSITDMQAAMKAGCPRILVRTGKGADVQASGKLNDVLPVKIHEDLADAITVLLGDSA